MSVEADDRIDLPSARAIVHYADQADTFVVYFGEAVSVGELLATLGFMRINCPSDRITLDWAQPYLYLMVVVGGNRSRVAHMEDELTKLFRPHYKRTLIVKAEQHYVSHFLVATSLEVTVRDGELPNGLDEAALQSIDGVNGACVLNRQRFLMSIRTLNDAGIALVCQRLVELLSYLVEPAISIKDKDGERVIHPEPA